MRMLGNEKIRHIARILQYVPVEVNNAKPHAIEKEIGVQQEVMGRKNFHA